MMTKQTIRLFLGMAFLFAFDVAAFPGGCGGSEDESKTTAGTGGTQPSGLKTGKTTADPKVTTSIVAVAKHSLPTFGASLEPLPGVPGRRPTRPSEPSQDGEASSDEWVTPRLAACDPAKETCPVTSTSSTTTGGTGTCDPAKETCPVTSTPSSGSGGTCDPAKATCPTSGNEAAITTAGGMKFLNGEIHYEIYTKLADPEAAKNDPDVGSTVNQWGSENFLNTLKNAEVFSLGGTIDTFAFPNLTETCGTEISKVVPSPFNFGAPESAYECAKNETVSAIPGYPVAMGVVWKKDGKKLWLLQSAKWPRKGWPTESGQSQVAQSYYDAESGEISVDYAEIHPGEKDGKKVCDTNSSYGRYEIKGNARQNTFTLRVDEAVVDSAGNFSDGDCPHLRLLGKGVSKGASDYFLLRAVSTLPGSAVSQVEQYFCVSGSAKAKEFALTPGTDLAGVSSNCAAYKSDVSVMSFFKNDELPRAFFNTKLVF